MAVWYRVFGGNSAMPAPAAILKCLTGSGASVSGDFAADASGWYRADLVADGLSLQIERYLADEEGIRAELNGWAAWLEICDDPRAASLMERIIQTAQLFTLHSREESARGEELCRFLAEITSGLYQIDERGFFAANGRLLIKE